MLQSQQIGGLMNAMYFAVPQSRERMIFIGVRKDLEDSVRDRQCA